MIFEESKKIENAGRVTGLIFSYLVFTTALFLLLFYLKRIPPTMTYFHMIAITAAITLVGFGLRRLLK